MELLIVNAEKYKLPYSEMMYPIYILKSQSSSSSSSSGGGGGGVGCGGGKSILLSNFQ